jgi:hypothetical protein
MHTVHVAALLRKNLLQVILDILAASKKNASLKHEELMFARLIA